MLKTDNNIMLAEAKLAKRKPNFFLQILIFIGIMLLIEFLIGVVISIPMMIWMFTQPDFIEAAMSGNIAAAIEISSNMPDWLLVVQLFSTVLETIAAIVYCRYIENRSLGSMGFIRKGWLKNYITGYIIGAVMIFAACGIAVVTGTMTLSFSASISILYLILFFTGYLVQGMAEETIVRGYFMVSLANSLKNRHAAAIAVFVSSVAFSLLHLANPGINLLSIINLILAGMFFAVYILRTGNIWGACAAHSAWNFFQGNVIGAQVSGLTMSTSVFTATISESGSLINGGSFGLEGGLAVTIVEVMAILIVIFFPQMNKEEEHISTD